MNEGAGMTEGYALFISVFMGMGFALAFAGISTRTVLAGFALMFVVILDYELRIGPWHDAIQRKVEQQEALQKGRQWRE